MAKLAEHLIVLLASNPDLQNQSYSPSFFSLDSFEESSSCTVVTLSGEACAGWGGACADCCSVGMSASPENIVLKDGTLTSLSKVE